MFHGSTALAFILVRKSDHKCNQMSASANIYIFCLQTLSLKRDKRELELKVQEQEEELDEQAGQIQILEQVCLGLRIFCILKVLLCLNRRQNTSQICVRGFCEFKIS